VFACFHIYGILFPIHPLTFAVAAFAVTAVNMTTHCDYRLPAYDWFFATARCHDIHHASREPKNISVMLSICERAFGTFQRVPERSSPPRHLATCDAMSPAGRPGERAGISARPAAWRRRAPRAAAAQQRRGGREDRA
jgi:sterol desaturase/sphingolipid hydroxylase (fatty acid hydroxylase superfamily)